jgi:threonine/homoserine/homoserine lactone efflux protein
MPEAHSLLLFLTATLLLNLTPGPDMLYVIARSLGQGRLAGVVSALGIAAGCLIHALAVAFGLASLLLAVPLAYEIIRYAGAAYLIYLGVSQMWGRRAPQSAASINLAKLSTIFLQGMLTNVLNPKVAFFFLAFLPQFVNAATGGVTRQMLLLGLLFNFSGTLVNIAVALAASFAGARLQTRVADSAHFRWLTASVLVGLGLRLALSSRD